MKTVCIVMPAHWTGGMGGAEYQAKLLIDGLLARDDVQLHYICRTADLSRHQENYQLHQISGQGFLAKKAILFDAIALYRHLVSIKPDVIYQRHAGAYTGVCQFYAKRHQCRVVWHIASDNDVIPYAQQQAKSVLKWLDKKILEYGLRAIKTIIAQTHEQADLLWQNYTKKVNQVIANFHVLPERGLKSINERPNIVWVANLKPIKSPEEVIELAKLLPEFDFIMIGRGDGARYHTLLQTIEQMSNVSYLGEQSQEQVNQLITDADFLLNTSVLEGFPNTFIQAWARATPVLSLRVDPNKVISTLALGYCCDNYQLLADLTRQIWQDKAKLSKMQNDCFEYCQQHHSLKNRDIVIALLLNDNADKKLQNNVE